ncbi:MAG: aldo/keto reductase [Planctomycetes bacterium]|nr:aldo/keto reductase [Planctomycetota bacterium]
MIKRPLGSTGYTISVIGVGAFAMGGFMWGQQDDVDSEAAIRAALEAGVTWIDTAPLYGEGRTDRLIGRVIKGLEPSRRPLVFTKFGHHVIDGKRVSDGSRARVLADCEHNLAALGVDSLDLFQLHWPCPQPVEETAGACAELLKAGKIRAIGLSNATIEQLAAWKATGVPLHCVQNVYSLLKPEAAEAVLPWCAEQGVGFLAYSPLFRGLLTGTWGPDKTFPPGDHRGERDDYRGPRLARALQAVEELRAIAEEDDLSVSELAVGYLLTTEGCTACIVGARNAAQGAALAGLGLPLRQVQMDAVDVVMARLRADLA